MTFETNNVDRIHIENNGKVGIGTTAPTAKLHVNGALRSNTVNIDPEDSTIEGGEIILRGAGTNNDYRIDNYDGNLRFFQPFQVAMTIDANANVAIGNVDVVGAYKLYVDEGILTERVKIATMGTAEWADYVFEEDYDLKSLNEIKQFVQQNKHLPNIPSAQEIEKSGYELQQMDAKLLEKIEELYLLTIRLNEEKQQIETNNKKLENTVDQLIKRIEKLEAQ